jgi:hypothetical protein
MKMSGENDLPKCINDKLLECLRQEGFNSRLTQDSLGRWNLKFWKIIAEDLVPIDFSEEDREIKEILEKKSPFLEDDNGEKEQSRDSGRDRRYLQGRRKEDVDRLQG